MKTFYVSVLCPQGKEQGNIGNKWDWREGRRLGALEKRTIEEHAFSRKAGLGLCARAPVLWLKEEPQLPRVVDF